MADDADTATAEERRAAISGRIESLERRLDVLGIETGMLAQDAHHQRSDCLVELEHDVADEAIAHDDVKGTAITGARRQIPTLEISVEVESGFLEECMRFLDHGISLLCLLPDRQQSNRRI